MQRILIIAIPGFGDVLLCTPLISAVRARWPQAELHVLLRRAAASVLDGNPDVDDIIEMVPRAGFRETAALLWPLRRKYDLVISNSISDRIMLYSWILGRHRVSLVPAEGKLWKRWLNHAHVLRLPDGSHIMALNRQLGEAAGVEVGNVIVNPSATDSSEIIAGYLGSDWKQRPFAVVHPSASLPAKHWRRDGWQAVVKLLHESGIRVVVTGGPGEAERRYVFDELELCEGPATCLVGSLRLCDIAELLSHCVLYVGVDTLVSHMASASGAPTVVLFGPSNPLRWGPWPNGHAAAISAYSARESQRVGNVYLVCDTSGSLDKLAEARVLEAIGAMLEVS